MSTTTGGSIIDSDVINPLGSPSMSSVRQYPQGLNSLVRSSNTGAPSFLVGRSASVASAAGVGGMSLRSGSGSPGSASPGGSADEYDLPPGKLASRGAGAAPIDISNTAVQGDSGNGTASSGSGVPFKQKHARTLASMMQAPFRANDASRASRDGDYTPRQSTSSTRAPLGPSLSFNKRLIMMRDAIAGIAHLHAKGYMHCDIKSLNFLVAEVGGCIVHTWGLETCDVVLVATTPITFIEYTPSFAVLAMEQLAFSVSPSLSLPYRTSC
jgi:hypothetical protein